MTFGGAAQGAEPTLDGIGHDTVLLVRRWLAESAPVETDQSGDQLAALLSDPAGLYFAVDFVDNVIRPDDPMVAGYALQRLAKDPPSALTRTTRSALWAGGVFGPVVPWVMIPMARRALRRLIGNLAIVATPAELGGSVEKLRSAGSQVDLAPVAERVFGEKGAVRGLERVAALLDRDDVDRVSLNLSSVTSQWQLWAFEETVDRAVDTLAPLYARGRFLTLDVTDYAGLGLTTAVFRGILDQPQFLKLKAGITLPAHFPDTLDALQELTEWALARRAAGGAPITVRLSRGSGAAREKTDAALHGWPTAAYSTGREIDANFIRVLDWAFTPAHADAVTVAVTSGDLFEIGFAWLLAQQRGVGDRVEFQVPFGMPPEQRATVGATVGPPVVTAALIDPAELNLASSYLIDRFHEEYGADANSDGGPADAEELFQRRRQRFLAAVADVEASSRDLGAPLPNRMQDRGREWQDSTAAEFFRPSASESEEPPGPVSNSRSNGLTSIVLGLQRGGTAGTGPGSVTPAPADRVDILGRFRNESDTDPALPANRLWGRRILRGVRESTLGLDTLAASRIGDPTVLDRVIDQVARNGASWGERTGFQRAAELDRVGLALAANRDRFIQVMASETGKTIAEADAEVSKAVDFAHFYAARARELDVVQGAVFVPVALTVVATPWNFPIAVPAGSVLAALAAGSAVILKPSALGRRCAAVLAEAIWEAGVPRDLLTLVETTTPDLGRRLITDPRVQRVHLTGGFETATRFRSWKPDLVLRAETTGKNSIIVTPSADYDAAVADIVASAFDNAGQNRSAASLVILVGSAARATRFLGNLADAAASIRVGYPDDAGSQMGPLIEPATGKLLHALTELGGSEQWLVRPTQLDETGRLWSPGIRTGVLPGSYFHLTEFFGPVLGIMRARTLEEAIRFQNAIEFGLSAGLQSLNEIELRHWLGMVEAGTLFVNRPTTRTRVQRQPLSGWKHSAVGLGAAPGGPNQLIGLGSWSPDPAKSSSSLHLRGLETRVTELIESGQPAMDYASFDLVRRSALSDAIAWATEFSAAKDAAGLGIERNLLRYRPVPVAVRLAEGGSIPELLRVLAAATLVRSPFSVSTGSAIPAAILAVLTNRGVPVVEQSDSEWIDHLRLLIAQPASGVGSASGIEPGAEPEPGPGPGVGIEPGRREAPESDGSLGRIRLVASEGGGQSLARAIMTALDGSLDVTVYAGEVTSSGRIELLPFLLEQSISITTQRYGYPTRFSQPVV
ncbi:MAG: proline dehydrogenase family protein [Microbacteriaceae bacterium]